MILVTINRIYEGLVAHLEELFPEIDIYGEDGAGDGQPPCIIVKLAKVVQSQELNNRYRRMHTFDIAYKPAGGTAGEISDIAERLYEHLALIGIEGARYHGTNMKHEVVENMLHFAVDYTFPVIKEQPREPLMQSMQVKEGTK
ncbi:phage tail terminator family protein [Paenibacillus nasutitermitis]|uniref:Phage protein n=1 Tax=Paenibacillus nasutitermitis TaxID=1652958 RepID=A0A916ZFX9_9BACL|nr:hypothetical protein [Paenibacillus nasutitermitis]GGD95127.1 hypothetical protein GCM10010911_62280 [Paenibacillus nasutitermitis]